MRSAVLDRYSTRVAFATAMYVVAGASAGFAFAAGIDRGLGVGVAVACGLCLLPFAISLSVEWGLPFVVMLVTALEEFPSGLGEVGEAAVERSTRTPFYSKSVGIGGLYLPDALIILVIVTLVFNAILLKRFRLPRADAVRWALLLLIGSTAFSAGLSIVSDNPFALVVPQDDSTVLYDLNARALSLIAAFQEKLFAFVAFGYTAGIFYIDSRQRLNKILGGFFVGICILCVLGVARIILSPSIIVQAAPLFYDSPSSWFFALICFFAVLRWASGQKAAQTTAFGLFSVVLFLFILLSYRRTMWGGMALCTAIVYAFLPNRAKVALLIRGGLISAALAIVVIASPVGIALLTRVSDRVNATSIADMSTLYRVALFVHFFNDPDNTPTFGYGLTPLWSHTISFGYLRFNLENVHSLFFWIWLRNGPFGFLCGILSFGTFLVKSLALAKSAQVNADRLLAICILTAICIFLFSGVFNPVYGEVRYMFPLGIMLAILSRLNSGFGPHHRGREPHDHRRS